MDVTGTQARYELSASADPTASGVSGGLTIGTPITAIAYTTDPDIAYSMRMELSSGDTLTLNTATGSVTGTVAGTNQVETATVVAASGITGNGNATVVFTSPLVTGTPLSTSVAVTTALTTATLVAGAIRTALQGVAAITTYYTIGGTGADITATAISKAANDATLNISTANGTCTGITTATTSVDTTAGVGTTRAYRISGTTWDTKDAEGLTLATATKLYGVLLKGISGAGSVEVTGAGNVATVSSTLNSLSISTDGTHPWAAGSVTFAATGVSVIQIDIQAGT